MRHSARSGKHRAAVKHPACFNTAGDFLKTFLWFSDEFDKRKDDPIEFRKPNPKKGE